MTLPKEEFKTNRKMIFEKRPTILIERYNTFQKTHLIEKI